jgi:hypothetical protein
MLIRGGDACEAWDRRGVNALFKRLAVQVNYRRQTTTQARARTMLKSITIASATVLAGDWCRPRHRYD